MLGEWKVNGHKEGGELEQLTIAFDSKTKIITVNGKRTGLRYETLKRRLVLTTGGQKYFIPEEENPTMTSPIARTIFRTITLIRRMQEAGWEETGALVYGFRLGNLSPHTKFLPIFGVMQALGTTIYKTLSLTPNGVRVINTRSNEKDVFDPQMLVFPIEE